MHSRDRLIATCGWILIVGSLLGAASAFAIIAWPAQAPETQFSYPFDPATYTAVQVFFSVRHLAETAGMVGLIALLWARAGRPVRVGLIAGLLGAVLFVAMELVAITAADVTTDSATASIVSTGYSAPTLLFGVGLVLVGAGVARNRSLPGASGRWLVLVCGIYVFVPLMPSLFGPQVAGRVAIGVWTLLLAWLGLTMVRAVTTPSVRGAVTA